MLEWIMHWLRRSIVIVAVMAAACDRSSQSQPAPAQRSEMAQASAQVRDLEAYAGRSYAEFVAAHEQRFGPQALGLSQTDAARLARAIEGSSGAMLEGGGAHALVFRGCAASGCADGVAVVAVDAQGTAFVGVRDAAGRHVLSPNDRLEALLRLKAPGRDWIDAGLAARVSQTASADAGSRP